MFGWLKNKISKVSNILAGEALRAEFARLYSQATEHLR